MEMRRNVKRSAFTDDELRQAAEECETVHEIAVRLDAHQMAVYLRLQLLGIDYTAHDRRRREGIKRMIIEGRSYAAIGNQYGITPERVRQLFKGKAKVAR